MIACHFENGNKTSLRHVVVHAIVEHEGKIILVKRADFLDEAGKWALPGGFLERGETASMAAIRELQEETGWKGEVVSLFRINSNPSRPKEDRQNVALEFIVKPIKEDEVPDKESSQIVWWPIDKLKTVDFAFDHGETVKLYLAYRQAPFNLPLLV